MAERDKETLIIDAIIELANLLKEERRAKSESVNHKSGKEVNYRELRRVRGVEKLVEYLEGKNTPIGKTTIYRLLKRDEIPCIRPSERVLLFDLDAIDEWLAMEAQN